MTDRYAPATLTEIATALKITSRGVQKRAKKEAWPYTTGPVRGGQRHYFAMAYLPKDVSDAVVAHRVVAHRLGQLDTRSAELVMQRIDRDALGVVLRNLRRIKDDLAFQEQFIEALLGKGSHD